MSRNTPRKIVVGVNDLATSHPQLMSEVDGWDPTQISAGMARKLPWKCSNGHFWIARVQHRAIGHGCPFCSPSNSRVIKGVNDLTTSHPEIAREAFGWDPSNYKAGSAIRKTWKCESGHVYDSTILGKVGGGGCTVCLGRVIKTGYNDLATRFPDIAKEADGWDPSTVLHGSDVKKTWLCFQGHRWTANVGIRTRLKSGCPVCSGLLPDVGKTDLATTHPDIAKEADGWDPRQVKAGTIARLQWKCDLGHSYIQTPNSRTRRDHPRGCPICSGRRILAGFNDLATTHPILAAQADGWDPTKVSFGMTRKLPWKCLKGHEWNQSPNTSSSAKTHCPICSNQVIRVFYNDLATTHPELAAQADGWDPKKVGSGNSQIFKWKCGLGHTWNASVVNRTNRKSGCPVCAGQKLFVGFNDLLTKYPYLALEADGWDPKTVLAGGNRRMKWICSLGHQWVTPMASRINGSDCPSCAKYGFDPNEKAVLYLFKHDVRQMLQIGITNSPETRLSLHRQRGWDLMDLWGPADGLLVRNWERSILDFLKSHGALMGPESRVERFDGYTESWKQNSFPIHSLKELMGLVHAGEDSKGTQ